MSDKEPVLLTVLIETARQRWFVAGVGLDGTALPLLRSDEGNIDDYLPLPFDEQVSFLRHRFSGALQRGNDRLWARQKKACCFVFVTDGDFVDASPDLTTRLADHMVEWMVKPPVVFCVAPGGLVAAPNDQLQIVSGDLLSEHADALQSGLPPLYDAIPDADAWESVRKPSV